MAFHINLTACRVGDLKLGDLIKEYPDQWGKHPAGVPSSGGGSLVVQQVFMVVENTVEGPGTESPANRVTTSKKEASQ